MATRRVKTVAVVTGIAAVCVGVIVGLYWQQIYYALYPEARLWGSWVPIPSPPSVDILRTPGAPPPTVLRVSLTGVEFPRDGGASVGVLALVHPKPMRYEGEIARRDLSFSISETNCAIGRSKVTFPDLRSLLGDYESLRVSGTTNSSRNPTPTVTLRYRFISDELLVLEAEEWFFPDGSRSLTLRRVDEEDGRVPIIP